MSEYIERCPGVGSDDEGWREGCEDCVRRTLPMFGFSVCVMPPPIIVFECEYRVDPKDVNDE